MKDHDHEVRWTAGKCGAGACPLTLVTYIGGGQWVCWLHALLLGIVGKGS